MLGINVPLFTQASPLPEIVMSDPSEIKMAPDSISIDFADAGAITGSKLR